MMFDFIDGAAGNERAKRLNREALEEISRQIQLRNLGGMIAIDVILNHAGEMEKGWVQVYA